MPKLLIFNEKTGFIVVSNISRQPSKSEPPVARFTKESSIETDEELADERHDSFNEAAILLPSVKTPTSSTPSNPLRVQLLRDRLKQMSDEEVEGSCTSLNMAPGESSETTPLKAGNSRPPLRLEMTPPVLQHNRVPASALPERLINSRRQLRKYASETSFGATAAQAMQMVSGSCGSGGSSNGGSLSATNEDLPTPPIGESREIRTPSRIFHVRPVPVNSSRGSNGFSSANAVINKINQNRRRQDSDDASGSIISENTIASGGTMTPVSRRNLRFKMKRPKSTGNMGPIPNHSGGVMFVEGRETTTSGATMNAYDPSFTSATIHSLDSGGQQVIPMLDERRPSNFYMMDDDSTHEFDDDVNGKFGGIFGHKKLFSQMLNYQY
ncbi:hypothetical protein FO519_006338 [Halicephalobus sp. NKZ332]|nr:hypothetical protein FO519_006338 [Halicephalobus sp. NKZ332]